MKGIETGKDKVKKICDVLKKETLEPAEKEAAAILERAHEKAQKMLSDAKKEVEKIHLETRTYEADQRTIFQASLNQACKQTVAYFKQAIEDKFFNPLLGELLHKELQSPAVLAKIIAAVVSALEKEGIDADLSVFVSAAVPPRAVNELLGEKILAKLKEKSVLLSSIAAGVEVKLDKQNVTLDITDTALKEVMGRYIRKDFREILFGNV